jgi:hypothetical protein
MIEAKRKVKKKNNDDYDLTYLRSKQILLYETTLPQFLGTYLPTYRERTHIR